MDNAKQIVADCLSRLAVAWGQSSLSLDPQGYCSLRTDDELDILLEVKGNAGELLFVADLGTKLNEAQAVRLLHANLFPGEIKFAAFCREATQGRVFLRYQYPIDALSQEKLGFLLSNFVAVSRRARKFVLDLADGASVDLPNSSSESGGTDAKWSSVSLLRGRKR